MGEGRLDGTGLVIPGLEEVATIPVAPLGGGGGGGGGREGGADLARARGSVGLLEEGNSSLRLTAGVEDMVVVGG
jgi:hypothetical protein